MKLFFYYFLIFGLVATIYFVGIACVGLSFGAGGLCKIVLIAHNFPFVVNFPEKENLKISTNLSLISLILFLFLYYAKTILKKQ
jgi:hypothetical protein